jgi:hypothetical protein
MSRHRKTEVYTWNSKGDESLAEFTQRVVERRPNRTKYPGTVWQRFWRSPWTWLVLTIINGQKLDHYQAHWYGHLLIYGVFFICLLNFLLRGNGRWGEP